jgi:hypothetical protein
MKQIQALQNLKNVLLLLGCIAMVLAFVCSGEPVISALQNTEFEKYLNHFGWKNSIIFDLAIGYLVSLMFWFLVVHLPEKQKKQILKQNLSLRYKWFKVAALQIFSSAGDLNISSEDLNRLNDYEQFNEFYRAADGAEWNKVLIGLEVKSDCLNELMVEMDLFSNEIDYALAHLIVTDKKDLYVFRQFKVFAFRFKHSDFYSIDQPKRLARFLRSVFGYWDSVSGQRNYDSIQDAIDRL